MARVVCPGGAVLVSVMSLWGTLRLAGTLDMPALLTALSEHVDLPAVFAGDDVVLTVPTSKEFHRPLALFTASGLRTSMTQAGLDVEVMASSHPLVDVYQRIPQIAESGDAVAVLQQLELVACERSGLLDTGSHLIAVGRRGATAF